MSAATVLIPTHNHGPLLYPSVKSALAQTIATTRRNAPPFLYHLSCLMHLPLAGLF